MNRFFKVIGFSVCLTTCITHASTLTVTNTFNANTPAVAAQVNTNFNDVKNAVDDNDSNINSNDSDIASLLTIVTQLQTELATANATILDINSRLNNVETNSVLELDGQLTLSTHDGYPTALFSGVNLQVKR